MKPLLFLTLALLCATCNPEDVFDDGEKIIYFPGTDKIKQKIEYKHGKKNGYFKEYYKDGRLKASQVFVNDTLNDTTLVYHPNGNLKTIHIYKNKVKHGCWRDYNKDGKMYSELFFKNGLLDSVCSEYSYRTVKLLTRIPYKKGAKHGVEENYHANGKIKSKVYYNFGEVSRSSEEWDDKGRPVNTDFRIFVSENDAVLLENKLVYKIRLEDPRPDDRVYRVIRAPDRKYNFLLVKEGDAFVCKFDVAKGGFVMEEVEIVAYRKSSMGNTIIKTQRFNAASNNF